MSLADELLEDLATDIAARDTSGRIVIGADRYIMVPEDLKKLAVQYDHNMETVTFDCPRYWDGHDMSKMKIYVNYLRADDKKGADLCTNVVADETYDTIMHFDWTITGHLTEIYGPITFLVCVKRHDDDGAEVNHWNSELNNECYVSEGLECETTVIEHYPGIITALLARMDEVEDLTTREMMLSYVEAYLTENESEWLDKFFASEKMMDIVNEHLATEGVVVHKTLPLYVGPDEPEGEIFWFDTSEQEPWAEGNDTSKSYVYVRTN